MAVYRQDIDFQSLFRKLGHNLEEIRIRALENIISKLEHHLICEQDIIHERHLIIRLLEWFNFIPCNKKEEVLNLLYQLSQHWGASELILSVGGVEFLTQLRADVESSLQPIIDRILENIMHLPEVKTQEHAPECIYHGPVNTTVWGNTLTSADETSQTHVSMATTGSQANCQPSVTAEKLGLSENVPQGYFKGQTEGTVKEPQPDLRPEQVAVGFRLTVFPWIPLTKTDCHIIHSTNRSLQSKNITMLISTCEFLSDVVFQDFPAEIFLQRPHIVKSLLSLLGLGEVGDTKLIVCVARTLCDLCRCLQSRIRYYQDPALYSPRQEFGSSSPSTFSLTGSTSSNSVQSSDTRPSLIGWSDRRIRGDGRDGDSSDSASRDSSIELSSSGEARITQETDLGEMESLQQLQLTLPQFAAIVLQHTLTSLHTEHQVITTELLRLGFESWRILAVVLADEVWTSGSISAKEVVSKFKGCLEKCAFLMDSYHHSHFYRMDVASQQDGYAHYRQVYLGVASLLSHLLHLVPPQKAADVIPDQLHNNLGILLFDESLAISYPQCHAVLTHFAQLLDLDTYRHFSHTIHIRQSMLDTCRFILHAKSKALPTDEAVALAENAVMSLPYHQQLSFVSEFVDFFSHVCSRKSSDKGIQSQCASVLLKLLSHPLLEVRQLTYHSVLTTIQLSLNPDSETAGTNLTGYLEAKCVLNIDILYEIVCFGLADSDNKVSTLAMELLFHLLQSHLLLGDILWGEFISSLFKSLPILQSYTDLRTRFGRRIWTMLDPTVVSDNLCLLDKLRGNLRLMLLTDSGLHNEVVKRLCWFLANESGGRGKLPSMAHLDPSHLSALFIVETPHYLDEDSSRSVFQVDGMLQVYNIFTADPVDPSVKKSAAEQLALMLQDCHLHEAFRQNGGLEIILSILHQAMVIPAQTHQQNPNIALVSACVTMLRHLLHYDYTLRHNLSHDATIYYDLLRVSILMVREENVSYQVSHIFTLLLFDEVAKFDVSSSDAGQAERNFSLPAAITKRYRLPFRPTVHHTVSPNAVLMPSVESDAFRSPGPQEMLRIAWNVAWSGGLDTLLQLIKADGDKLEELRDFNNAMVLTPADKLVIMKSHLRWLFQEGVYAVANATSHSDVVINLNSILAALATIPSAGCADMLNQLNWIAVLDRFLQVKPSSHNDENLLLEVFHFINNVIRVAVHIPQEITDWLAQRIYDNTGPIMGLLDRVESGEVEDISDVDIKRSLHKELLQTVATFMSHLPYKQQASKRLSVLHARGDLACKLLQRLNISASAHLYNLAALEGTLVCLLHLTARSGWSEESTELEPSALCSHILHFLLEVVWAFHIGRGNTSMSYMGRGVSRTATLCLRQLAHEMAAYTGEKDWAKNWLYSRQEASTVAESGLNWMLTLWAYRDTEVRAAGLGIAVALTSTEVGRALVTNNCRHIPGGIWGAAFSVLLDPTECSIVRQQAALLLVNLTSEIIPSNATDATSASVWQGPLLMDIESNISLGGLNALLALLHHSHFYQQLAAMFLCYFPASVLQPVLITTEIPLHSLDSSQQSIHTSSENITPRDNKHQRWSGSHLRDLEGRTEVRFSTVWCDQTAVGEQNGQTSVTSSSSGLQLESSSSSLSQQEGGIAKEEGMTSVVAPCLIAAVSQFLGNLAIMAPDDTFTSMAKHNILTTLLSMIDTVQLQVLCHQLTSGAHQSGSMLTLRDLLRMYSAIISLLGSSVKMNSPTRTALLGNKMTLRAVTSLMLLQCDSSSDLVLECRHVWHSVLQMMCILLQTQSSAALQCLTEVLYPIWTDFSDALVHLLEVRSAETQDLFTLVTTFLSLLLMEEAKLVARDPHRSDDTCTLTYLLDVSKTKSKVLDDKENSKVSFTTGSTLSKVLIATYELTCGLKVGPKSRISGDSLKIINTLKPLLIVSQCAKQAAVDMGLVETLIDMLKEIHACLSLDALQLGNKFSRKKDDGLLQELLVTLSILCNLLYGSERVKLTCMHSGLGIVIHKLWAWCLQEASLMSMVLTLLINFTAKCTEAATSLAWTSCKISGPSASRQQQINNSLILTIAKATQREIEKEFLPLSATSAAPSLSGSHLKLFFTLLTSLSLSFECRSLIWKSNLLQDFSKLSPGRSRKSRSCQAVDGLWFELAVSLSFSADGQQMLLRLNECLTVLLDFLMNGFGSPHCQEYAILVLRNICCHAVNKPKILANELVIPCCIELIESAESIKVQTLAASALWCLAFNNHKAKVAMKGVNIVPRMQACLRNLQNLSHSRENMLCVKNIQAVITAMKD